ncbi:hypothetical protein HMPREF0063_12389 [Aeromicrobium marinum DSM 15272]|uniref:DoxX family protein n=1 Tax=Aeromicrobium marinum DSM 15272 TaxID=585531 RepID=E2SD77_9ACTN|nr:hypothetical protein [Aeromicrobium marinum]EFQ83180.1 hypothetical protein HMPREF0063_12389 [Aeromicrobium marinum DSM 15272]
MTREVKVLAGILGAAGVLHFVKPGPYEQIVPKPLPYKRELVYASGVVEVASAAMLMRPATRPLGGRLATLLLVAVFPANVQMTISAMQSSKAPWWFTAGTVLRLPLQLPLIRIAARAARSKG